MDRFMTKNEMDHWYTLRQWPCGHGSAARGFLGPGSTEFQCIYCTNCGLGLRVLKEEHPRFQVGTVLLEPQGYKQPRRVWTETALWRALVGRRAVGPVKQSLVKAARTMTWFYVLYCVSAAALIIYTHQFKFAIMGIAGALIFGLIFMLIRRLITGGPR